MEARKPFDEASYQAMLVSMGMQPENAAGLARRAAIKATRQQKTPALRLLWARKGKNVKYLIERPVSRDPYFANRPTVTSRRIFYT